MAIVKIPKGRHRPRWWIFRNRLWWKKRFLYKTVCFDLNSKYWLAGDDQHDVNKLFGIGYFPGPHKDSARFGWRYEPAENKFILSAYVYSGGARTITDICDCKPNCPYHLGLEVTDTGYNFQVERTGYGVSEVTILTNRKPRRLSYALGLYFGGNRTAPTDLSIHLQNG